MKKVLIIDDTKTIRLMLTKYLEVEGYQVTTAETGQMALDILEKTAFDLILLDIKMPSMSGTEVLRQMRKQQILTPVIIMTAYGTIKNAVETTNLGASAYLQKPFTTEKLKKVLDELAAPGLNADTKDELNIVFSLLSNQEYEASIVKLKSLLAQDSLNPQIYFMLYKAYYGLGDEETSQKYFRLYESIQA